MNLPSAKFFRDYYHFRAFSQALSIIKKHPEANVVSPRTQSIVRVFGIFYLLSLIGVFIWAMLFVNEEPRLVVAGVLTAMTAFGLGLLFLIILYFVDRKSNFNKIAEELSLGGKPKNYDPLLVKLDNYGLLMAIMLGIIASVLYAQISFIQAVIFSVGLFFIIKGIVTIIKKRDYTKTYYIGEWSEGDAAIKVGLLWLLFGIVLIILSVFFISLLEQFFTTNKLFWHFPS